MSTVETGTVELLRDVIAFSLLSDEELQLISPRFQRVICRLGEIVTRAGDPVNAFFIITSGRARVVAENDQGREVTVATLTAGQSFGERACTVRAMGELELLRLDRACFLEVVNDHPQMRAYLQLSSDEASLRQFLKVCPAFSQLSSSEIGELLSCLEERNFLPGEVICHADEPTDAIYILRSGRVTSTRKPGAIFGMQPGECIAEEASTVFRLAKRDLDHLMACSPAFKSAMASIETGSTLPSRLPSPPTGEFPLAVSPGKAIRPRRRARRYPALLQLSESDCGAACLAMILRYYQKHVSINRLRDLVNVSRDGASLHSLAEGAEALGFRARGLRAQYEHLKRLELPAIVHWENFHYVVLYEAGNERVVIADPATGLRQLTREEFVKGWTGYLLCLSPTEKLDGVVESRTTFGRFLPLLKPHYKLLAEILLASLVLQLFGLATPLFTQVIIDKVVVRGDRAVLNMMLAGMLLVAIFQTATSALRQYLLVHTSQRIDMQMVVNFYHHLLSLPMRYFEERRVGDILKRFNENARIRDLLTGRALGIPLDALTVAVYLALMCYYNMQLTLVALAFLPGYAVLVLVMTPLLRRQYRESFAQAAEADSYMVEAVTGIGAVKASATERRVRWKLEGLMVRALNRHFRSALLSLTSSSVGGILQTLGTVVLLWYGARLVISGDLTVGQLVAFNVLAASVMRPILNVLDLWNEVQQAGVGLERLNDVFDAKPEEEAGEAARMHLPTARGHIKFSNVSFRYPTRPETNAVQNVSLEIEPGQTVAIVGRSGAGKTTFANLLLRLHEPDEGCITIDGHDLHHVSRSSLRAQIGVVPQDVFLFSGTIRENIALGDADAPLNEVIDAAMLAGAHDFIRQLPSGYETKIGERGQSLSGGQRQRIAIARALYRKPRILIFDEATSALDAESERAIQGNLDRILKGRTTLVIAHRLSTIRNADLIVVLDRGSIVEKGTHESLMRERGVYYHLNAQQLGS